MASLADRVPGPHVRSGRSLGGMDDPMEEHQPIDSANVEHVAATLLPPAPSGWSDALTGTDGPRFWDRLIASEVARVGRYERPATVVLVEVAGLDDYARALGPDVAVRLFIQVARTLSVESRSSDHIARIDRTRFGILLTETDEIAAINFVERVRASCESELRSPELVRIGIGWAGPSGSNDLRAAIDIAETRLAEELGRSS
jgi:diguanylate cyclase (GGDEF)-like protein